MDADRFDMLAKRWSRRRALRGCVGATGALAALLLRRGEPRGALALGGAARYTVIRHYHLLSPSQPLQQMLEEGYAPQLAAQPGFLEFATIDAEAEFVTITVFASQAAEEAAGAQLADWVRENLASLLPEPDRIESGPTLLRAAAPAGACPPSGNGQTSPTPTTLPVCIDPGRPGVGCACAIGTEHPCGETTLLCCPNDPAGPPGELGICTPSAVGCNPRGPDAPPACHGIGCGCVLSAAGTCDEGLVCMGPIGPGLPGLCATPDGCGSSSATAVTRTT